MKDRLLEIWRKGRGPAGRLLIVVLGIVLGQAVLYGPSMLGIRILLPLDLLAEPDVYLPRTPEMRNGDPHDAMLADQVFFYELARRFAVSELRAGRIPLWTPYRFIGGPCFRWTLSPPCLLGYLIASPVVIVWIQVLIALLAGTGAYVFFRRVLKVSFWPAAVIASCYPLTGAYVIWQGFWQPAVMCWLPWVLLAVDKTVRQPTGWGGPVLAILTAIALAGGAADIGGQLLLASGIYAIWCYLDQYGTPWITRRTLPSIAATVLAWTLGILASTVVLLPLIEYIQTGVRAMARSEGHEERPPMGLGALPQVVFPNMYGSTYDGSLRITHDNVQESSVGAFAGLLATLLVAPLAWCSRRHRSINILWVVLAFVALSWSLDVPGIVDLLRLPGLNMMSHNRFVYVAAFAIMAMAVVGLELLWQGNVFRSRWFLVPAVLLLSLCVWCIYRTIVLPEPVATQLRTLVEHGQRFASVDTPEEVARVQFNYRRAYVIRAAMAAVAVGFWCWLWFRVNMRRWLVGALSAMLLGELLWFGFNRASQCNPDLYYPRIPVLQQIADAVPGRIVTYGCLPANLNQSHNLRDVRGYDGVDPARLMDLLKIAADPRSRTLSYALTQWYLPKVDISRAGYWRLSPVLDMLNVRYLIFRGPVPPDIRPDFKGPDYWVLTNTNALPRVFVPHSVETVEDDVQRLAKLAASDFHPAQVAYVECPVKLPASCRGSASIVEEVPMRVTVSADMVTPGLVVLSDLWDGGWKAFLDEEEVPILRTNHAVRGVVVPKGRSTLQFRYEPASLAWGLCLCGLSALAWIAWVGVLIRKARIPGRPDSLPQDPPSQTAPSGREPVVEKHLRRSRKSTSSRRHRQLR